MYDDKLLEIKILQLIESTVSIIYSDVKITNDSHLIDDLGFDSITLMQLIIEIEEEFTIEMDDATYEEIIDVKSLIAYIKNKLT